MVKLVLINPIMKGLPCYRIVLSQNRGLGRVHNSNYLRQAKHLFQVLALSASIPCGIFSKICMAASLVETSSGNLYSLALFKMEARAGDESAGKRVVTKCL